jgi:hypothetical protein
VPGEPSVRAEYHRDVVSADADGVGEAVAIVGATRAADYGIEIDLGVQVFQVELGGTTPSRTACMVNTASTARAALSELPSVALDA